MGMIEVGGLRVAYKRAGDGPPLVLLHGYAGDGPATWRWQLEGLCGEFTVVAWDARGAGRSPPPPESFGMAGYADCLAGFAGGLGLVKPHVAGLSFGGAPALAFCRRHPAIPGTLILASAYAGWACSLPADVAEQRLRQALVLMSLPPSEFAGELLPTTFSEATPRVNDGEFGASMLVFHPAGFRAIARVSAENLRDALPHINVPTLLVYRGHDARAPLTVAEGLYAAMSGSALVVLPEVGHLCHIEDPGQFNSAARDFLRGWRS